jgi:adenylate cyclase
MIFVEYFANHSRLVPCFEGPRRRNAVAVLSALGLEFHQRWQKPIPEGQVIRLGRAPRHGWKVPWDPTMSREHADLLWQDGKLRIERLQTARTPVVVEGAQGDTFLLDVGGSFQIGHTKFVISVSMQDSESALREIALDQDAPKHENFADAGRRLELVSRLPGIIAATRSDEEFAEQLLILLLEALPRAQAVATARFENVDDVAGEKQPMIRLSTRNDEAGPFSPSMRLIRAAIAKGRGILHFFGKNDEAEQKYTVSSGMDWAICTPISTKGPDCWCLYVAGSTDFVATPDALRSDLRFTSLMAQFIGAIQQVRQLEKIQAGMSQYFSPAIVETMSGEFGQSLLAPKISDITVIFCDVRGFSRMTEDSAVDLFPLLNRVSAALGTMTRNIVKYDGVIADFQGDAALGFWGWPVVPSEGAIPACQAALAIHEEFCRARSNPDSPLTGFKIGIGLAHGQAIAGKIGSDEQAKVGVFGPVVNLGSRLEGMSKQFGVDILMDEATTRQVRNRMAPDLARCRRLGRFYPCGLTNCVAVGELLPPLGPWSSLTDRQIADFEAAVDAVAAGDWPQARALFERLPNTDGPRSFYLEFLSSHNDKPPVDWDGVVALTSK